MRDVCWIILENSEVKISEKPKPYFFQCIRVFLSTGFHTRIPIIMCDLIIAQGSILNVLISVNVLEFLSTKPMAFVLLLLLLIVWLIWKSYVNWLSSTIPRSLALSIVQSNVFHVVLGFYFPVLVARVKVIYWHFPTMKEKQFFSLQDISSFRSVWRSVTSSWEHTDLNTLRKVISRFDHKNLEWSGSTNFF